MREEMILAVCMVILVIAVLLFLWRDNTSGKDADRKYTQMLSQNLQISKKQKELEESINGLRSGMVANKDEVLRQLIQYHNEVNDLQEHCAKLRGQQQIMHQRQIKLRDKMIPHKIEVQVSPIPVEVVGKKKLKK